MVISSSATDELTPDSSGTFSFDTELSDGDACDVQIIAQPANPENVCTVRNGGGTVSSADIDNVPSGSVWANRYEDVAEVVSIARVAVDDAGNALDVWEQSRGTPFDIWGRRYTVANGWEAAESISIGEVFYPKIAFDASGHALSGRAQAKFASIVSSNPERAFPVFCLEKSPCHYCSEP